MTSMSGRTSPLQIEDLVFCVADEDQNAAQRVPAYISRFMLPNEADLCDT